MNILETLLFVVTCAFFVLCFLGLALALVVWVRFEIRRHRMRRDWEKRHD